MTGKVVKKEKVIVKTLDEVYAEVQAEFIEYITSLNIPAIQTVECVPVLALEVTVNDERLGDSVKILVDRFGEGTNIKILSIVKIPVAE